MIKNEPKKILVTGGAGFIGHHLVRYLLKETTCDIVSIDRLDTSGNLNRLAEVLKENPAWNQRFKHIFHDLKAPISSFTAKKIGKVDYILHLAAASHVDRSIQNPLEFVMDNVVGTTNLLEHARHNLPDLKQLLYFSTDEVFGAAPNNVLFKENDRHMPGNPYAASKSAAESLCVAYERTYDVPIIITHTMNVFGNRQHAEKYIPLIIKKCLTGEKLEVHSNSACTEASKRHYLHVTDVCSAILFLMEHGKSGEKYNIVANEESDNLELALDIANLMQKELNYELIDPHLTRPRHDFRYSLCGKKMKDLGWRQKKTLEQGLREVISWTLQHKDWL